MVPLVSIARLLNATETYTAGAVVAARATDTNFSLLSQLAGRRVGLLPSGVLLLPHHSFCLQLQLAMTLVHSAK